jgi:polyferredoxin
VPAVERDNSRTPVSLLSETDGPEAVDTASHLLTESGRHTTLRRKKLVRRDHRDYSQRLRFAVQLLFAALNLWIGLQFYLWVRWAESGGQAFEVSRPAGVEGWLPIEGLMQLKYFLVSGQVPHVHAAGFFLFTSFLVISLVFRKAFCSWICPVGTVSEYLWKLGRSIFGRTFQLPRWADIPLRSLKYLVLIFFAYAVIGMSAASIAEFLNSPYALIVDVRMLNFFRYLSGTAAWVIFGLVLASIFVQNFWCRYLCPYGGFLGLVSLLSPTRITRNSNTCIDCAMCAKACPSALPVDKLLQIRSAECTGCLECVAICPAKDALTMSVLAGERKRRAIPAWSMAAGIAILFLGMVGYAKVTGQWNTNLPKQVYLQLVPNASEQHHPMPGAR